VQALAGTTVPAAEPLRVQRRVSSRGALFVAWRGAPPVIGVISIAILELFAVGLGVHAVKVARDGDSPFPFNLGITLIAVIAAVVQFAAAVQEGKGVLFGVVMAMAPIAAITLWVVEVRRFFRLQGRVAGTVAQPAATIEPALWVRFFKQAWTAKKFALIDRSLGADDAMKLGILHSQPKPKALVAPVRRDRGIAVEDVVPQLRSLTASTASTSAAPTAGPESTPTPPGRSQELVTEVVYRKQLRPVIQAGATVMDQLFTTRGNQSGNQDASETREPGSLAGGTGL
jgi:hypothetical protein